MKNSKLNKLAPLHLSPKRGERLFPSPVRGGFIPKIHNEGIGRG